MNFYKKQPTYHSGFRKRGAEKRARPTGASGQPIRYLLDVTCYQILPVCRKSSPTSGKRKNLPILKLSFKLAQVLKTDQMTLNGVAALYSWY